MPHKQQFSRRQMLRSASCGFGSMALAALMQDQMGTLAKASSTLTASSRRSGPSLRPKLPHHSPKAKRVIFIWMQGGPSQVDSFDPKPDLKKYHNKKLDFYNSRQRKVQQEKVMNALWKFKQYGKSGQPVSELFPHIAQHVDDLCFIKSMHTEGVAHGPASLFLHTGATNVIRPSMGAWVQYGLGTENQNLPGFVTVSAPPTKGGPRNYGNAFLPTIYQGTTLGRVGMSPKDAQFKHVTNKQVTKQHALKQFEYLRALNNEQLKNATSQSSSNPHDDQLEATLESYELAFRMQQHAPELTDISKEPKHILDMYGIGSKATDDFGRQCLLARRLSEAGVRFVQINYADTGSTPKWDQHSNMPKHKDHAFATDQPVAGLLGDLKQRGLLEDTIVWWGGEFGRTPFSQGKNGRDHNPDGFTVFLAGGGVKRGFSYGETDNWGHHAAVNKTHMHDLHATILHLMGIDHERLTYRYAGRDFRLTDLYGHVATDIIA
jgi:hypothetical protein